MTTHDSDTLNLARLERDVSREVEKEQRYWRENDAKFRAVHQKVATYDEFRDIVAASHLKPLDKGEKLEFSASQPWNQIVTQQPTGSETNTVKRESSSIKTPTNGNEFVREWRKLKDDWSRFKFLRTIGPKDIGEVLQKEIPFGILGEILSALNSASINDLDMVLDLLLRLTKTKRFELTLQFLNKAELIYKDNLFQKLDEFVTKTPDLDISKVDLFHNVVRLYGVKVSCEG